MGDFKGTMLGGLRVGLHQLRVRALGSLYVEVISLREVYGVTGGPTC
jgi:hypothetical protein